MQRWLFQTKKDTRFQSCGKFDTLLPLIDELERKEIELRADAELKKQERNKLIDGLSDNLEENGDLGNELDKSTDELKYEVIAEFNKELKKLLDAFNKKTTEVTSEEIGKFILELSPLIEQMQTNHSSLLKQQRKDNKETVNAAVKASISITGIATTLLYPPTLVTKAAAFTAFTVFRPAINSANHAIRQKVGLTDDVARSWRIFEEIKSEMTKIDYSRLQTMPQSKARTITKRLVLN